MVNKRFRQRSWVMKEEELNEVHRTTISARHVLFKAHYKLTPQKK